MTLLRIEDNSKRKKEDFSIIPNLTKKIADKTLDQLEKEDVFVFPEIVKDSDDITSDQMILNSKNGFYWTSNVMGFIGYGEERLIIQSRFSQSSEEDFFFQYLLDRVLDYPNIVNLNSDADPNNRLYNYLLFLFPYYLKEAMRKGLYKEYVRHQYNDENVKGTIDVVRHIEKNTPFLGKIAYSQREFSYDNPLLELIRHTIEFIKNKPYGMILLSKAKEEVGRIIDSTPSYEVCDRRKVIEQNKKNTIRHAYFREYRLLQRLCLLILQHQKHQIGKGKEQIYGILFDGAWLWEEYVNLLVKEYFYHPMNKAGKGKQRLFNNSISPIYPDFIGKNEQKRIIADAKYKRIGNIKSDDYLQVLAYMYRFDAKMGFYLYPNADGDSDKQLWLYQGTTYENNEKAREDISVVKHGLTIPQDAEDYESFVSRILLAEKSFRNIFEKAFMDSV